MVFDWTKPHETNYPRGHIPHDCWGDLKIAHGSYNMAKIMNDKNKMFQAIIDIREHQFHMGAKIDSLESFNVTQDQLDEWLISDPDRTKTMLRNFLVSTMNREINENSKIIKEKYLKKLNEYKVGKRGKNYGPN